MKVLQIVEEEINCHSAKAKGFTFSTEYKIAVSVTACGYSVRVFEQMIKEWRKSNYESIECELKEKIVQRVKEKLL